jgi:hypothetical protein
MREHDHELHEYYVKMISTLTTGEHRVMAETMQHAAAKVSGTTVAFAGLFDTETHLFIDSLSRILAVEKRP